MNVMREMRLQWGFLILLIMPMLVADEGNYQADVRRIKLWTRRDKQSLIEMDKLGQELLTRYRQPEEQGEIYYYLAHQHAQGGLVFTQKVIDYAFKALEYPVTPDQKMRLYVYRGDAFQVLDRKKPFAERRREAVISYLQGLRDLESFTLPDTPPAVPNTAPKPFPLFLKEDEARKFEEERQKYIKAREHAEFIRTMMMHRDVLQGQIVSLYGRRPVATDGNRSGGG
jgi:hypothetical protein